MRLSKFARFFPKREFRSHYGNSVRLTPMILIGREHITLHSRQFPSARTALAMWQAISQKAIWTDQAAVASCFPAVKFLTPKMARFFPAEVNCVITTQIAFNTGILIVLAVNEVETIQFQRS